jgi:hypothetical protein
MAYWFKVKYASGTYLVTSEGRSAPPYPEDDREAAVAALAFNQVGTVRTRAAFIRIVIRDAARSAFL